MKWISNASTNRKMLNATSTRLGSNRSQSRHMIASPLHELRDRVAYQTASIIQPGRGIAIRSGQPGAPHPGENVRNDGDHGEDDEARDEDSVELFRLRLRQPR